MSTVVYYDGEEFYSILEKDKDFKRSSQTNRKKRLSRLSLRPTKVVVPKRETENITLQVVT